MPVLLLNRESVAAEIMELARIKIATQLRVPIDIVVARWEHEEGHPPKPAFEFDMNKATSALSRQELPPLKEDDVRQSMGAIWRWMKDSLVQRLEGIKHRRGEC